MTRLQIVFLFASYKQLNKNEQNQVREIVRRQYDLVYGNINSGIDISLEDGISQYSTDDIIIAMQRDGNEINEATYRKRFCDGVAEELKLAECMRCLGFSGRISWQDGLLEAPESGRRPAQSNEKTSGGAEKPEDALDYHKRAKMYKAADPKYTFEMLALPQKTLDEIQAALNRIEYERKVFEEWGLYAIMPSPVCALSFFGPPGTGKSLAAEAIASKLKKKIIRTSYADIENKYVGEGPKNVSAVFIAAEEQDAVLLIDEADSLLSKRLVNVQEASGQAINSMRSQLLISLERFHGIVIFATNLVVNYDAAFISRLINVKFELPDAAIREKIWENHLLPRKSNGVELKVPLAEDVDIHALAEEFPVVGRDIRNSVVDACVRAASNGQETVNMDCLRIAVNAVVERNKTAMTADDHTRNVVQMTDQEKDFAVEALQKKLDEQKAAQQDGLVQS